MSKKQKILFKITIILMLLSIVGSFFIGIEIQKRKNEDTISNLKTAYENEKAEALASQNESISVGGAITYKNKSIQQNISSASNLTTLVEGLKVTGLDAILDQPGSYTIFAPDNTAFEKLTKETVTDLLKPENKEHLKNILNYHIVKGKIKLDALSDGMIIKTIDGKDLKIKIFNDKIMVNEGFVILSDSESSNGILHILDTVLLP